MATTVGPPLPASIASASRNTGLTHDVGDFPYWEWGLDCADPQKSPLFDGSETSLGSDGAPETGTGAGGGFGGFPGMAGGTGGGCVMSGPFSNYTVNLGPSTVAEPLAYNPRCIKRNLNGQICGTNASLRNTTDVITQSPDIELFQAFLQGDMRYPEARGFGMATHGGGHFTIGEIHLLFFRKPRFSQSLFPSLPWKHMRLTDYTQAAIPAATSTSRR